MTFQKIGGGKSIVTINIIKILGNNGNTWEKNFNFEEKSLFSIWLNVNSN
jgi:hypothetical protein